MKRLSFLTICLVLAGLAGLAGSGCEQVTRRDMLKEGLRPETEEQRDKRMAWWREARFGMFIHWGLYAIAAGEWKGETNHAEWIRHSAQIPIDEYDKFVDQFNPVQFNADQWVRMAKDAGMKYIVITSKHHDGFCLFDSEYTDYDSMSTPFKRDILKELSKACKKHGIKLCFYHSIMDWHHPDYLPRREWEKRSANGADYPRYIGHMKSQLKELVTRYDPAVLWFDGEWENTWTHEEGLKLYNYVRSLKPDIIINNRVDKGRGGMEGMTRDDSFAGDFGTPEQEVPHTGIRGVDWESCITMNNHWGYNSHDKNFKSTEYLIHQLVDIVSKDGNYLLNIGPTAKGTFPQESIDRLRDMGKWMKINGEAIYCTSASPFKQPAWGRFTEKSGTVYAHLFNWPPDVMHIGELGSESLGGIKVADVEMLGSGEKLHWTQGADSLVVSVPSQKPSMHANVLKIRLQGRGFGNLQLGLDSDALNASVTCMNYSRSGWTQTFDLHVDGKIVQTQKITINPQTKQNVSFIYEPPAPGIFKVAIGSRNQVTNAQIMAVPGIKLRGEWRFQKGDKPSWKNPNFNDSQWEVVKLPEPWETHSNYTQDRAFGWYRKTITVGTHWKDYNLVLPLGKIDDVDETFFNGKRIGGMGHLPPKYKTAWNSIRRYTVPKKFISYGGENVIAIRVFDDMGGGGLYGGPLGPSEIAE